MKTKSILMLAVLVTMLVCRTSTQANVIMSLVAVGNAGNANDGTGYGGVAYVYYIGKYEVTA